VQVPDARAVDDEVLAGEPSGGHGPWWELLGQAQAEPAVGGGQWAITFGISGRGFVLEGSVHVGSLLDGRDQSSGSRM